VAKLDRRSDSVQVPEFSAKDVHVVLAAPGTIELPPSGENAMPT